MWPALPLAPPSRAGVKGSSLQERVWRFAHLPTLICGLDDTKKVSQLITWVYWKVARTSRSKTSKIYPIASPPRNLKISPDGVQETLICSKERRKISNNISSTWHFSHERKLTPSPLWRFSKQSLPTQIVNWKPSQPLIIRASMQQQGPVLFRSGRVVAQRVDRDDEEPQGTS